MEQDNIRLKNKHLPNILLRSLRKEKKWTQQDVADKVGVPVLSVGRWERGEVTPQQYSLYRLCKLFGKSAEELGFSEEKENNDSMFMQEPDYLQNTQEVITDTSSSTSQPFSEIVKNERILRGWSQNNLASHVGIDVRTVVRWEQAQSYPTSYARRKLFKIFDKTAQDFNLIDLTHKQKSDQGNQPQSYHTKRTFLVDLPIQCGDCEELKVSGFLEKVVLNPSTGNSVFYLQFNNRTGEDIGLKAESISLSTPNGDFFLGKSVGSFLIKAKQQLPFSVTFEWMPKRKIAYTLNIVLIRPNKWRNTYQPLSLSF